MRDFTALYDTLDGTTKTGAKQAALVRYFRAAAPADAAWALYFLAGRRLPRAVSGPVLRQWAAAEAQLPAWLVEECYDAVGDLGETLALLLPPAATSETPPPLHRLVEERIRPLRKLSDERRRALIRQTWQELNARERFLFHKLMLGGFRVGVAQGLLTRALAEIAGVPPALLAHRLMGDWQATPADFAKLLAPADAAAPAADDPGKPYPFALAHPLEADPASLGHIADWQIEWKWDGMRAQLLHRRHAVLLWSRGEELLSDRFPEVVRAATAALPAGTVLDGELLAWREARPLPFALLQQRITRKRVDARLQSSVPVVFLAYDLLEWEGRDCRSQPLAARRALLEAWHAGQDQERLRLSPVLATADWEAVSAARADARAQGAEGLMLKRIAANYAVGRVRGNWWKWKLDPYRIDAVLLYAQPGHGKRASLYTDYTFGVWQGGELVPVAKAYSGLTDAEILEVDRFIRANTREKFGPVRAVRPELVFELAFEGVQVSSRHKAGVALRFPRMSRWRRDKQPADADTLAAVRQFLPPGS